MVDGIECFRKVYSHCHWSVGRTQLVETRNHLMSQREESSYCGASGRVAMLGDGNGKVWSDELGEELLHNFGCWAEEEYWSERWPSVLGFARFG